MFVNHQTGDRVYFKRRVNQVIVAHVTMGKCDGLRSGDMTRSNAAFSYQLLVGDNSFYPGVFHLWVHRKLPQGL